MGGTDTIPDEFSPSLTFDRPGRVAMANAGPQTGSSQFFITDAPTPHLNGRHTIFGQVVDGQDVEQKIARVPRDEENDKPKTPVRIVRITFKRVGPGPQPGVAPSKRSTARPRAAKPRAAKPKPAASKPAAQSSGTSK
jgi:peptidyl-prolyl cis-trans isomerase A (cyclophilin A)